MGDRAALDCFARNDLAGMFRRLNGIWMVDILATLDELAGGRGFDPNPAVHRVVLTRAGVNVARMEVALGAVAARRARTAWASFAGTWRGQLAALPQQQQSEVQTFVGGGASLANVVALSRLDDEFIRGFVEGAAAALPGPLAGTLSDRITANPLAFLGGFQKGYLSGLITGLEGLVRALIDLFRLALRAFELTQPLVIGGAVSREAWLLLTNSAHRRLRMAEYHQAEAIVIAVNGALRDMVVRPDDYLRLSGDLGRALGEHLAKEAAADLEGRDATQLGDLVGRIAGQIAFEIIVQLLFLLATEGVGNAARATTAATEATQGAGRLAALTARIRPLLMKIPGIERLIEAIRAAGRAGAAGRVDLEVSAAVERAFAEGAEFESSVIRFIPVRDIALSAEQATAWRTLRGAGRLEPEFAALWRASSNPAAEEALVEVRRLWAIGDEASRTQAQKLARLTFDKWRRRFMTRLRQPANAAARARIEAVGFRFEGAATSSPTITAASRTERLTLEHSSRLIEDPTRCVDPANLEFVIGYENSVTLEQLRRFTSVEMF